MAGGLNAKFNFVKQLINDKKPIAFFVFEANLKLNKSHEHLTIDGYDLTHSDSLFPRTACYFKKDVNIKISNRGEGNDVISLDLGKYKILGVYRPFKLNENETLPEKFDKLMNYLENECKTTKEVIVAGDFNIDLASMRHAKQKNALDL